MASRTTFPTALLARGGGAVAAAVAPAQAAERSIWNMPPGATAISHEVYGLHMMAFWICVAIGVVVFGIMFYSIFAFRRSRHPQPAQFHESTAVEVVWTIVPFIILVLMARPAAGTLIKMYDSRDADMTVKITAVQWRWQYQYLDSGVAFTASLDPQSNAARQLHSGVNPNSVADYLLSTDRNFVVPVGKKVRLLITANDVIHGWWVPDLAVKRDAIPGFINEVWFKVDQAGIYRGQCTVLCGRDHGFMPIVVEAKPEAEFAAWLATQKTASGTTTAPAVSAANSDANAAPKADPS